MCFTSYDRKVKQSLRRKIDEMVGDIKMSLYHEQFERDVIQPTEIGIYLLALFYLMQNKYRDIRYWMFPCKHKNWVDESYGNPDSGGDGGYCKDCGWSFWHQYY